MNALWRDPERRALVIAAMLAWALLSMAIVARGAEPASCRIHNRLGDGSTNVGSGTLIDVTADGARGLVLTCGHLFTEGRGRVVVEFPSGRTHGANVIAVDSEADLAALEIASPQSAAAPIGLDVDSRGELTACGFGPDGQFRCVAGSVIGAAEGPGQVSDRIAGAVRSGDSGSGVFDGGGRLVGVVWGEAEGVTYASTGGPLRLFLQRVLGRRFSAGQVAGAGPSPSSPFTSPMICPDGQCPLLRPSPFNAVAAGRAPAASGGVYGETAPSPDNCGCDDQLAAIAARIDALESGKQDRGDYVTPDALASLARSDDVAQFDGQSRQRHESLVERIEVLGGLVAAAGRVAAPLALPALGVSGPAGWGLLAGTAIASVLIGRWMKRRRGERRGSRGEKESKSESLAPRPSPLAPPPEATADADCSFRSGACAAETRQPIERDDREARELLRLSQLEGRDPLQDAVAGRLALDRLDAAADGDADPQRARWADDLRRDLRERFNEIAPTKFQIKGECGMGNGA